jgi:hypothetical protein
MKTLFGLLLRACPELPGGDALAQITDINSAINKAGRQRMLSQRMAKAYFQIGQQVEVERSKKILDASVATFDRQLVELKNYAPTPEIKETYLKLEKAWLGYKDLLVGAPPSPDNGRKVLEVSEDVLAPGAPGHGAAGKAVGIRRGPPGQYFGSPAHVVATHGQVLPGDCLGRRRRQERRQLDKARKEFAEALRNSPRRRPIPRRSRTAWSWSSSSGCSSTYDARQAIHRILHGADDRLLVVIGPCSIHDYDAAIDYATRSRPRPSARRRPAGRDARVFREAAHHRGLEGPDQRPAPGRQLPINEGLRIARHLLVEINEIGLPAATEFLDMITPQYIADLIAWGAIGARTTESQVHRELASGLSCPVGFKNGTDGNLRIAVDAIRRPRSRTTSCR